MCISLKNSVVPFILFGIGALFVFSSCLKEKEGSAVMAAEVTYENTIKGLLSSRGCVGCHTSQSPILTDYTKVKDNFTVVLASINHDAGTSNMPKSGSKMPDAEIQAFVDWEAGSFKEN